MSAFLSCRTRLIRPRVVEGGGYIFDGLVLRLLTVYEPQILLCSLFLPKGDEFDETHTGSYDIIAKVRIICFSLLLY